MKCPYCRSFEDRVHETRPLASGIEVRRRRECMTCGKRFTTRELRESLPTDGPPMPRGAAQQLIDLERDLRESLRGGYLFGNFDEPLDAASLRVVRVIQQRLSDLPCDCTDRTPDGARCRACGGLLPLKLDVTG